MKEAILIIFVLLVAFSLKTRFLGYKLFRFRLEFAGFVFGAAAGIGIGLVSRQPVLMAALALVFGLLFAAALSVDGIPMQHPTEGKNRLVPILMPPQLGRLPLEVDGGFWWGNTAKDSIKIAARQTDGRTSGAPPQPPKKEEKRDKAGQWIQKNKKKLAIAGGSLLGVLIIVWGILTVCNSLSNGNIFASIADTPSSLSDLSQPGEQQSQQASLTPEQIAGQNAQALLDKLEEAVEGGMADFTPVSEISGDGNIIPEGCGYLIDLDGSESFQSKKLAYVRFFQEETPMLFLAWIAPDPNQPMMRHAYQIVWETWTAQDGTAELVATNADLPHAMQGYGLVYLGQDADGIWQIHENMEKDGDINLGGSYILDGFYPLNGDTPKSANQQNYPERVPNYSLNGINYDRGSSVTETQYRNFLQENDSSDNLLFANGDIGNLIEPFTAYDGQKTVEEVRGVLETERQEPVALLPHTEEPAALTTAEKEERAALLAGKMEEIVGEIPLLTCEPAQEPPKFTNTKYSLFFDKQNPNNGSGYSSSEKRRLMDIRVITDTDDIPYLFVCYLDSRDIISVGWQLWGVENGECVLVNSIDRVDSRGNFVYPIMQITGGGTEGREILLTYDSHGDIYITMNYRDADYIGTQTVIPLFPDSSYQYLRQISAGELSGAYTYTWNGLTISQEKYAELTSAYMEKTEPLFATAILDYYTNFSEESIEEVRTQLAELSGGRAPVTPPKTDEQIRAELLLNKLDEIAASATPIPVSSIPFYDQEYGKQGISEQEYLSYTAVADCDWDGAEELLVIYCTIPPYDANSTFTFYYSHYEIWDVQGNECTLTQQKKFEAMAGNWGTSELFLYSYGGKGTLIEKIFLRASPQEGNNEYNFFYGENQKEFRVLNEIDYDHDNVPMVSFQVDKETVSQSQFEERGKEFGISVYLNPPYNDLQFSGTMEEIFGGVGYYTPVSAAESIANARAHLNNER